MIHFQFRLFFLLFLAVSAAFQASPQAQIQPVTFSLGETVANPGDIVEVPLFIDSSGLAPEVCVLFINYDPSEVTPYQQYYEFVQTDLAGQPLRDPRGNVITASSAVRPEFSVTSTGKVLDTHVSPEGYISLAVVGVNTPPMPDGLLATVAFRVAAGLTGSSVLLDGDQLNSSAAARQGSGPEVSIPLVWEDAEIVLGCDPPAAPTGVSASTNGADAIVVSWQPVSAPGVEYRVFRSTQINLASAVPLGDGWQTTTSFTDITALSGNVTAGPACPRDAEKPTITHYYWVQARNQDGCISEFSSPPASGNRAKAHTLAGADSRGAAGSLLVLLSLALLLSLARTSQALRKRSGGE